MSKYNIKEIYGQKGGGKGGGGSAHTPTEDPTIAQSNVIVRLVDLLCEGEIEGLVNGNKSVYLDEIQLQQDGGAYNYSGVTISERKGTADQTCIPGITESGTDTTVINTEVTYEGGGITTQINDTDVDDVRVIISVPQLYSINSQGDIKATTVVLAVDIQPDGEGWQEDIKTITITDKFTSIYQTKIRIKGLDDYGNGPWTIRLRRTTADSTSAKLINKTWFHAIVLIKNKRINYADRALIGIEVNTKDFGSKVVSRAYDIKGQNKIKVPNNRTYDSVTDTATYSGTWGGTFKTEWSDNPAWVVYDIINKNRYGLGLDTSYIDKWGLYTIGVYCDTQVDDGFGSTHRRFTFNVVINNRADAINVINMMVSNFRSMVFWSGGKATFVQDSPKDGTRLITAANVENGLFNYAGTELKHRYTVANVSWNNPDDFFRLAIETVENAEGIERYGVKPIDVVAYGCSNKGQAYRYGKWILETSLNETEIVTYVGGMDHADLLPGEIIQIADPHNSLDNRFGGRTVSGTVNSLVIDNAIDLESGETYSVSMTTTSGTLIERDLTNAVPSSDVETLTWDEALDETELPQTDSVWLITASNLAPKEYRVLKVTETDEHKYEVSGIYHDSTKYARVEEGIYLEAPAYINIPAGELTAPTNIDCEEYTYIEGGSNNQLFGVMVSWTASTDPRIIYYELQTKKPSEAYLPTGQTSNTSYDVRPVTVSGSYNFRVRGISLTTQSSWLTYSDFNVSATLSGIEPPTGLQVRGGGTTWSGSDCEIEWTASIGAYNANYDINNVGIIKQYKIEVLRSDDTLLRTDYVDKDTTTYTYSYEWNTDDNNRVDSSDPYRQLKFNVYTIDVYDNISTADTDVFNNPAPTMAGTTPTVTAIFKGIKIDWSNIKPADNDGYKFKVYSDTSTPPTTQIAEVSWDTTSTMHLDLSTSDLYYVQIEPFDYFGAGTKSSIPTAVQPIKVGEIDIDAELTTSISITSDDTTVSGELPELYDRIKDSGGPNINGSPNEKYINYDFGLEYFIDRVSIWMPAGNVYIGYAGNDDVWHYLKAEADYTLDADGELLAASNQADAQTNYWTTTSGLNVAIFPAGIIARNCRLYVKSDVYIYELVFGREVIAEFVVADNLAAISADLGAISAGTIQSTDWGVGAGTFVDLATDGYIKLGGSSSPKFHWDGGGGTLNIAAVVTFESTSAGYTNISDKPTSLGDVNASEGTKLGGIAEGADVTSAHTSANAATYTGASIATSYTAAKCTDATADKTSTHTAANASTYTGASIITTYTAAKCTDANADQTSAHTSADTSLVSGLAASKVAGWAHGSDTTKIDGGDIYTNTVTASQINGAGFGTLTITSGKIAINTADALEIQANGNIKVLAGGDIVMVPSDTNPSLLRWGSIAYMGISSTASRGLCIWPETARSHYFRIGYDPVNSTQKPMKIITLYGSGECLFRSTQDTGDYASLKIQGSPTHAQVRLEIHYNHAASPTTRAVNFRDIDMTFAISHHKEFDFGLAASAWDDAYADDWHNVGDFYHLDGYNDLQTILDIKPSGEIDERTGLPLIDDSTLPDWMLTKHKKDTPIINEHDKTIGIHKKGELTLDPDNKPWITNKVMFSLLMGAVRELNTKIEVQRR